MDITMAIFLAVTVLAVLAFCALIYGAIHGSPRSPRYSGQAPHRGKVMRFTGMSSHVKEDSGKQHDTKV